MPISDDVCIVSSAFHSEQAEGHKIHLYGCPAHAEKAIPVCLLTRVHIELDHALFGKLDLLTADQHASLPVNIAGLPGA